MLEEKLRWNKVGSKFGFKYRMILDPNIGEAERRILAAKQLFHIEQRTNNPENSEDWVSAVFRLPLALREVLVQQLALGNLIIAIGEPGWPNNRSIIVNMFHRFVVNESDLPLEVGLQIVNDPHQWLENISQIVDGQEYMLMA